MAAHEPDNMFRLHQSISCSLVSADGSVPYVMKTVLNSTATQIAAMLSNGKVKLFDVTSLEEVASITVCDGTTSVLRDMVFGEAQPYLYTCTSSGTVTCFDTARRAVVFAFDIPVTLPRGKPDDPADFGLYAIAINALGELLAVSLVHEILFFDVRKGATTLLGRYAHSHVEAVTQLQFHPVIPHHLISGSDDGLVCIFDTSIKGEDDAIVVVLNAESSVSRFGVFGDSAAFVWILTRTDTLSIWNIGSAERIGDFSTLRMQLLEAGIFVSSMVSCNYDEESSRLVAMAACEDGTVHLFDVTPEAVTPLQELTGGHHAAARTACWAKVGNEETGGGHVIFTGAEDSTLAQWVDAKASALIPRAATATAAKIGSGGSSKRVTSWRLSHRYVRNARSAVTGLSSDADAFATRDLSAADKKE